MHLHVTLRARLVPLLVGLLCAAALLGRPATVSGQGLRAGIAVNELTDLEGFDSRVGLAIGASVGFLRFGPVALVPELLYVQKGAKRSSATTAGINDIRIDWFEIPVLLRYGAYIRGTPVRPSIYTGAFFGFEAGCSFGFSEGDRSQSCTFAGLQEIGFDGAIDDSDQGWIIGGGVDVLTSNIGTVGIDVRYTSSFSSIARSGSAVQPKARTWLILAGWSPAF